MKINCGTDIIEIDRVKKAIENIGDRFLETVFSADEIKYCEARKQQKYQHYAARFAAKEAIFKAVSDMLEDTWNWKSFEILKKENGKPEVRINCRINGLSNIDVSISHCKEYAVANVIAVFEEGE